MCPYCLEFRIARVWAARTNLTFWRLTEIDSRMLVVAQKGGFMCGGGGTIQGGDYRCLWKWNAHLCASLEYGVRDDLSTGYRLRFSSEIYRSDRDKTVFIENLQDTCGVLTQISGVLREFTGECNLGILSSSSLLPTSMFSSRNRATEDTKDTTVIWMTSNIVRIEKEIQKIPKRTKIQ